MGTINLPEEAPLGVENNPVREIQGCTWWGWGAGPFLALALGLRTLVKTMIMETLFLPTPVGNNACWEDLRYRTLESGRQLQRQTAKYT